MWIKYGIIVGMVEQATTLTGILGPGVYILSRGDRVTFIGRAKCLLVTIAAHRTAAKGPRLPDWFPIRGVIFDSVSIIPTDYPRALLLAEALVKLHKCSTNLNATYTPAPFPSLPIPPPIPLITRRPAP